MVVLNERKSQASRFPAQEIYRRSRIDFPETGWTKSFRRIVTEMVLGKRNRSARKTEWLVSVARD